jgi:hypothetical protein
MKGTPMKTLGLIALMICCLMLPASAQSAIVGACTQAKEDARAQIALADTALAEDRVAEASDLLRDARLLLTRDCGSEAALFIHGNTNLSDTATISAPPANPDGGVAFIRIANLSVDVDAGGVVGLNQQLNVTGLGFGEFTGLIPIPSGTHTFGNLTWDFASNSTWVLATTGVSSNQSVAIQPIAVIRNDLKGQARVRVVQAISGLGRVNVTSEEGTTFGDSLGWLGNQDTMVDAGDYILRTDTAAGAPVIPPTAFTFDANQSYVLFLSGSTEGDIKPEFVTLINPQDTTRVRFVNEGDAAADVHYRPGNAKIADRLEPGETSEWVEVPTSSVTFVAYGPGDGPTGQELASLTASLRSGRDMTISVNGGQMTISDISFTQ